MCERGAAGAPGGVFRARGVSPERLGAHPVPGAIFVRVGCLGKAVGHHPCEKGAPERPGELLVREGYVWNALGCLLLGRVSCERSFSKAFGTSRVKAVLPERAEAVSR